MKMFRNIIVILLVSSPCFGEAVKTSAPVVDELTSAYQREILFLSTYKKELKNKIASIEGKLTSKLRDGKKKLQSMESQWLEIQTSNELLMQKFGDVERDFETRKENKEILEVTLKQSSESNSIKYDKKTLQKKDLFSQLEDSLGAALAEVKKSAGVTKVKGTFFNKDGAQTSGEIIQVGGFARYGVQNGRVASLYPSGQGTFKVWSWLGESANVLLEGTLPVNLSLFLFDNPEKEFVLQKEKTMFDVVQSGGLIGWIIVIMGFFSLFVSILRYFLLEKSKLKNEAVIHNVGQMVQAKEFEKAQHLLITENSAVTRVLSKTLSFLRSDPSKVEDAIQESIIKESQVIDRFGVVLLVIASVAPLMGLLGTVTGMISTFDIITLYGTGNPKLLSGGISEALVTTMLGLIVAIPSLLVGQYLNSKNEKLKSDMEKWALSLCNSFKNNL